MMHFDTDPFTDALGFLAAVCAVCLLVYALGV